MVPVLVPVEGRSGEDSVEKGEVAISSKCAGDHAFSRIHAEITPPPRTGFEPAGPPSSRGGRAEKIATWRARPDQRVTNCARIVPLFSVALFFSAGPRNGALMLKRLVSLVLGQSPGPGFLRERVEPHGDRELPAEPDEEGEPLDQAPPRSESIPRREADRVDDHLQDPE